MLHGQGSEAPKRPYYDDSHQPMLQAITDLIIALTHNSDKTTLMDVKSHIGIKGSEMADELAAEAVAVGAYLDRDVLQKHCEDLDNKVWPQQGVSSGDNGQTHMQSGRALNDPFRETVHDKLRPWQSSQESTYWAKPLDFTSIA